MNTKMVKKKSWWYLITSYNKFVCWPMYLFYYKELKKKMVNFGVIPVHISESKALKQNVHQVLIVFLLERSCVSEPSSNKWSAGITITNKI